ncbi:cupin domain-containing protein [Methylobacterium sp. J-076]|uniref:cupin domain-containing protein n=1 Tax=Methylobacterium sp. J-076 TaxID=2836655 RepID=UPI001FBA9C5F|nr:cupin domain-containing protein [Methylobacterium sp. J-076]MCJ2015172.1 cupin domain-containing protein [Methylobacterium sp. J-076]
MSDQRDQGTPPTLSYWHVYTDAVGVSRQARFEISAFKLEGVNHETAPQWNDKQEPSKAAVTFTVLPVGWVGQWHENPKPQWIAILSGRWFVETMDGTRVEMGPGELMMGEDQNTREQDGKKGHLSGTIGDEPCTMIVTGLDVAPTVNQPGRFR